LTIEDWIVWLDDDSLDLSHNTGFYLDLPRIVPRGIRDSIRQPQRIFANVREHPITCCCGGGGSGAVRVDGHSAAKRVECGLLQ